MAKTLKHIDNVCRLYDSNDQAAFVDAASELLNRNFPGRDRGTLKHEIHNHLVEVERDFFEPENRTTGPGVPVESFIHCPERTSAKIYDNDRPDTIARVALLRVDLEILRARSEARRVFASAAAEKILSQPPLAKEAFAADFASRGHADDEKTAALDEDIAEKGLTRFRELYDACEEKMAAHKLRVERGKQPMLDQLSHSLDVDKRRVQDEYVQTLDGHRRNFVHQYSGTLEEENRRLLDQYVEKLNEEKQQFLDKYNQWLEERNLEALAELRQKEVEERSQKIAVAKEELKQEYGVRLASQKRKREGMRVAEEVASKQRKLAEPEVGTAQDQRVVATEHGATAIKREVEDGGVVAAEVHGDSPMSKD